MASPRPKILVVDDEENIRTALRRWFEAHGFEVTVAADGDEAVAQCASQCFDIVTLDMEMPRMNGKEAFAAIHEMRPDMPVIVLTGYFDHLRDPELRHVTRVLIKPLSLHVVEEEVRKAIGL